MGCIFLSKIKKVKIETIIAKFNYIKKPFSHQEMLY